MVAESDFPTKKNPPKGDWTHVRVRRETLDRLVEKAAALKREAADRMAAVGVEDAPDFSLDATIVILLNQAEKFLKEAKRKR